MEMVKFVLLGVIDNWHILSFQYEGVLFCLSDKNKIVLKHIFYTIKYILMLCHCCHLSSFQLGIQKMDIHEISYFVFNVSNIGIVLKQIMEHQ